MKFITVLLSLLAVSAQSASVKRDEFLDFEDDSMVIEITEEDVQAEADKLREAFGAADIG